MTGFDSIKRAWIRYAYMAPFTPLPCDDLHGQRKGRPSDVDAGAGLALWVAGAGVAFAVEHLLGPRVARILTAGSASYLIFAVLFDCFVTNKVEGMSISSPDSSLHLSERIGHSIGQAMTMSIFASVWMVSRVTISLICPLLQGAIAYRTSAALLSRTHTF